jgi:hypothetical protein
MEMIVSTSSELAREGIAVKFGGHETNKGRAHHQITQSAETHDPTTEWALRKYRTMNLPGRKPPKAIEPGC